MHDKYGVDHDPACYPGTATLKNRLGLRDPALLAEAEAAFAAVAVESIEIGAPPFDFDYLCSLHAQLFGDVYGWAGQPRSIDIAKGQTRFCTAGRIIPEATRLLKQLAAQGDFRALCRADLVWHAAELYGELNMVHPFRDGNGRVPRLFFEHLILVCGYGVSWQPVERDEWVDACIAAVACNYVPLAAVFDRCIGTPITEATPGSAGIGQGKKSN